MKSMLPIFLLTAILISGSASAQIDQGIDGIGLYADAEATINNITATPGEVIELYLMATNISSPDGINAYELSLSSPQFNIVLLELVLNNEDFNVGTFPDIMVGCSDYKETAPIIELARIRVLVMDSQPAEIYIGPFLAIEGGSAGNYLPGYVDTNSIPIFDLHPSSGSINEPVFRINGDAPVATTNVSLQGIKTLYR